MSRYQIDETLQIARSSYDLSLEIRRRQTVLRLLRRSINALALVCGVVLLALLAYAPFLG